MGGLKGVLADWQEALPAASAKSKKRSRGRQPIASRAKILLYLLRVSSYCSLIRLVTNF